MARCILPIFKIGSLGETSIVASGLPIAVGGGLSAKLRGTDQVSLAFFGDGAVQEGAFHESLNLAAIWKLPVIFYCENNQYGMTTSFEEVSAVPNVADRASAYGIPGVVVDGQDVLACWEVTQEAVRRARAGVGQSFIEAKTHRQTSHSYRVKEHRRSRRSIWLASGIPSRCSVRNCCAPGLRQLEISTRWRARSKLR